VRIILGNGTLARYPQGGGHWMVRLQYLLGLRQLGHDPYLLALLSSTGARDRDEARIASFFSRLREYALDDRAMLLLFSDKDAPRDLASATAYGRSLQEIKALIASADLLWNDCSAVLQPLLSEFKHRVMIDLDPGLLQASIEQKRQEAPNELTWERDIFDHHAYLSVGSNLNHRDCGVPTLGLRWTPFVPFAYLPMWPAPSPAPAEAPFTSVTHWNWDGALPWKNQFLSFSKRDAYLRYLDLPVRTGRAFELAANLYADDGTGDAALLTGHGWRLADPWQVSNSPAAYQRYIAGSRAEIACPKPVYRQLRTGWFSDRSVCYLASGRPVLAEDTGFSRYLPTGHGLLTFTTMEEAVAAVAEIDANYAHHSRAARELAHAHLDSQTCLQMMLEASLVTASSS